MLSAGNKSSGEELAAEEELGGETLSSGKTVEERVGTALGHYIRVAILTLLNEGTYTADDLAALIGNGVSRQMVHYHLKILLEDDSIEIAKTEKRRNADLHFYRAINMACFSEEDLLAMTSEERQVTAGLIVQHSTAELMAALDKGKLSDDPQVVLAWRWFNLDEEGRRELMREQERLWWRAQEIEAESTNRRASSGEEATSIVVAQWGFERARKASKSSVSES
jgi:DNA-binding transcriptional ArsR family regulator